MGDAETLRDLLKEGVAIQYDRKDGVMMVWVPDRTVKTLTRVVELLEECFGVDPSDVEVHPTTVKTVHKLRLEFPYSFDSDLEVQEGDQEPVNWVDLTDSMAYCIKDGELKLGWRKDGRIYTALRVPMDGLKELYDRLPEEATTSDIRRIAGELDLNITGFETYIMRVLSRRVEFGGDLVKEGRTLRLIKDTQYLREENRRKLAQEMQVIGKPWEVQ